MLESGMMITLAMPYAVTTHAFSVCVAPMLPLISRKATFTIVVSISSRTAQEMAVDDQDPFGCAGRVDLLQRKRNGGCCCHVNRLLFLSKCAEAWEYFGRFFFREIINRNTERESLSDLDEVTRCIVRGKQRELRAGSPTVGFNFSLELEAWIGIKFNLDFTADLDVAELCSFEIRA